MRQTRTWLTTDTHFNHTKLATEGWRPKNFEYLIKRNWMSMVHPDDVVYHLGDVIVGRNSELSGILATLPGTKILIRGNHDHESDAWYMRRGFACAASGILHRGVWLTHAPQAVLPDGAVLNVHGHLHNRVDRRGLGPAETWQKLLALEFTDYKPVEFTKFVGLSAMALAIMGGEVEDKGCAWEDNERAYKAVEAAPAVDAVEAFDNINKIV